MTRFEVQQQMQNMGHRPGAWSPIEIPGDVANGYVMCEECGEYIVIVHGMVQTAKLTGLCRHNGNVNDYLYSCLHVKSNNELNNCPIRSIVGEHCKWIIDAAFRLIMESKHLQPGFDVQAFKEHVVKACEAMFFE
jgi:hypothetical protein